MQDMLPMTEMALATMMAVSILLIVFAGFNYVTSQGIQQAFAQVVFSGISMVVTGVATLFYHLLKQEAGIHTRNEVSEFSAMFGWVVVLVVFVGILYVALSYLFTYRKETKDVQEMKVITPKEPITEIQVETQAHIMAELDRALDSIRQKYTK